MPQRGTMAWAGLGRAGLGQAEVRSWNFLQISQMAARAQALRPFSTALLAALTGDCIESRTAGT